MGEDNLLKFEKYHTSMVSDVQISEIFHEFNTQINELLNIQMADTSPKNKKFLRSHFSYL